jgi:hypothetical protein
LKLEALSFTFAATRLSVNDQIQFYIDYRYMPLTAEQKSKVESSIRTQYSKAGAKFIPPKVAKARALRLVLSKPKAKSK